MKSSSPSPAKPRTTPDIKQDPEAARKAELRAAMERERLKKGRAANDLTGSVDPLSNVTASQTLLG